MKFKRNDELVAHGYAPGDYDVTCADCGQRHISDKRASRCLGCAISHFAPPRQRMMIKGMTEKELFAAMFDEWAADGRDGASEICEIAARVAHRLATTPAIEHDPDCAAKALLLAYRKASAPELTQWNPDDEWLDISEASRNGWRAVAAMEKGNG